MALALSSRRMSAARSLVHGAELLAGLLWPPRLNFVNAFMVTVVNARVCMLYQSHPTLCDPTDCSPPGSSVYGDSPGKYTGLSCHVLLLRIFPSQELNLCLLYWEAGSLPLASPRKPTLVSAVT